MKRAAALALAAIAGAAVLWVTQQGDDSLSRRLAAIRPAAAHAVISCAAVKAANPVTILVLGQSNAANHGPQGLAPGAPVTLLAEGRCHAATEPLAGGTGAGASLWPRVSSALGHRLHGRPLAFALVAIDGTTIANWTRPGILRTHLEHELQRLRAGGMKIDLVLWQQGEADAKAGTPRHAYHANLESLKQLLAENGVAAPVVAAQSTYCPGSDGSQVRAALSDAARDGTIILGPDTDTLQGAHRAGCHFSATGLDAAAALWARTLRSAGP